MGPRDIEDLTIELLAEEAKCSPDEMRRCLEEGGGDLPIDSILLVEVVVRVEERLMDAVTALSGSGPAYFYFVTEAMIQAGRRRLRPIVMTALAAMSGMLPLALAWGAGSQMLQPLAIAVIGGILISMVLSLIITPAMYFNLSRERAK